MDVGVSVGDWVTVALCEAVGLTITVGVLVSVGKTTAVIVGRTAVGVGVGTGGTDGVKRELKASTSRRRMPTMIGKAFLRSIIGKVALGTTGISPVYPKVANKLLRLAA